MDWYVTLCQQRSATSRCPFASVERCTRCYQSLFIARGSWHIDAALVEGQAVSEEKHRQDAASGSARFRLEAPPVIFGAPPQRQRFFGVRLVMPSF
jgi:hypothetical protein